MRTFLILLLTAALPLAAVNTQPQDVAEVPGHECVAAPVTPAGATVKNVIFMIGDGMGSEQVWAGRMVNKGPLNIEQLPVVGFSRTPSFSHTITDSAAGGTALACGQKTINGHIGQDPEGNKLDSLLCLAEEKGMATGLVVTKDITDATPAAFYAHSDDRRKAAEIAGYLPECGAEFVRGGGSSHFTAEQLEAMRAKGMDIELAAAGHMAPASQRGDVLPQDVARALDVLGEKGGNNGLFLMVEGSQIDVACHANNLKETVCEMLDFDKAVGVVLEWMKTHPDTLLVITADHQTGGLSLLGGDREKGTLRGVYTTGSHNGIAVPVFAAGPGSAVFSGIHENTDIFELIKAAMEK